MPSQISQSIPITSICAFFVAAMAVSVPNNAARAADCLAAPGSSTPQGATGATAWTERHTASAGTWPTATEPRNKQRRKTRLRTPRRLRLPPHHRPHRRKRCRRRTMDCPRRNQNGCTPSSSNGSAGPITKARLDALWQLDNGDHAAGPEVGPPGEPVKSGMRLPGRSLCNSIIDRGGSFKSGQRERPLWRKPPPFPERGSKFAFDCNCNKRTSSFAFAALSDAAER